MSFSTKLLVLVSEDDGLISHLIIIDKAHFHFNGFINKHNCRVWASENPPIVHQHVLLCGTCYQHALLCGTCYLNVLLCGVALWQTESMVRTFSRMMKVKLQL